MEFSGTSQAVTASIGNATSHDFMVLDSNSARPPYITEEVGGILSRLKGGQLIF
jgi:hypothetical protein